MTTRGVALVIDDPDNKRVLARRLNRVDFRREFRTVWGDPGLVLAASDSAWAYQDVGWILTKGLRVSHLERRSAGTGRGPYVTLLAYDEYEGNTYRTLTKAGYVRALGGPVADRAVEFDNLTSGQNRWYWWDYAIAIAGRIVWVNDDESERGRMTHRLEQVGVPVQVARFVFNLSHDPVDASILRDLAPAVSYDKDAGVVTYGSNSVALTRYTPAELMSHASMRHATPPAQLDSTAYWVLGYELAGDLHRLLWPDAEVPRVRGEATGRDLGTYLARMRAVARGAGVELGRHPLDDLWERFREIDQESNRFHQELRERDRQESAYWRREMERAARQGEYETGRDILVGGLLGAIGLRLGKK